MTSFDHIYLLDLHGSSIKKEKCPDGSKDENVFDIQQGVAIGLFIKQKGLKKKTVHSDLWGLREEKYEWLLKHDFKSTKWNPLNPKSELYLFVPRDEAAFSQYEKYSKITEIFPCNNVGIVTARDEFVIDFDKNSLKRRIVALRDKKLPDEFISETYGLKDKAGWKLKQVREKLRQDDEWENSFSQILYRPFDIRWIFYNDLLIERSRKEVMRHMLRENLGLISARSNKSNEMNHFFVSNNIMETKCGESTTQSCIFPLYFYPDTEKKDLLSSLQAKKEPNIKPELFSTLTGAYGKKPSPEDIFYYIYAVFYSNTYRTKYAEFLKTDFPRVPFTGDYNLFLKMSEKGKALTDLHLMKSPALDKPTARLQGKGDFSVEKLKYDAEERRVHINPDQFFEGIEKEVWEYMVGGYQVLMKWLKDRKGRKLSLEEIQHYCRVATALSKTIEIQKEIGRI
jgi:predicted helicase